MKTQLKKTLGGFHIHCNMEEDFIVSFVINERGSFDVACWYFSDVKKMSTETELSAELGFMFAKALIQGVYHHLIQVISFLNVTYENLK